MTYNPQIAEDVLARLPYCDGGLEQACKEAGSVGVSTFYRWLAKEENASLRERYAHARELAGDVQAQRGLNDALSATDASIGRLKWDARRWTAGKLRPKVYGDKVALTGGNADDTPLIPKSDNAAADQIAKLLTNVAGRIAAAGVVAITDERED